MSFIAAGSFSLVSAREFIQLLSVCTLSYSGLCVLFLRPPCPYLLREQVTFPKDTTEHSNIFLHSIYNCLSALFPALSSLELQYAGQNVFYSARKASHIRSLLTL